jgi:Mrp family chromosome partitioning ATPase
MEKLKAALDKARLQREANAAAAPQDALASAGRPGAAQTTRSSVAASDVEVAWKSLASFSPDLRKVGRRRVVSLTAGAEAISFDILRTKVLQLTSAHGWQRIAITSPLAGSGKTTTAINLATSLARQGDMRVILMDLDMRRPGLATLLGAPPGPNVSEVLEGKVSFSDQAYRLGDGLAVSINHISKQAAADLLLRRRTAEVIDEIERAFQPDFMLFDMPPMLVGDDASAFLSNVDCAILVAEAGATTTAQVDTCEKELAEQTNVLGTVLNKCRFGLDGKAGYYY